MPEKAKLEEEVNEVLGTEIEWSRLTKDELELFHALVHEGDLIEPMAKYQAKEYSKEKLDEKVDEWKPGQVIGGLM